jgi:hypothetical protein
MTNRLVRALARAMSLAILLLAGPAAVAKDAGRPVVREAQADADLAVLAIRGEGLGGNPKVRLGPVALQPLTNDGTTLTARLPPGIAPGTYRLALNWRDGRVARAQATVGVVAEAPTAASPPGPAIVSAGVNEDRTALTVVGRDLGREAPAVRLGGRHLRLLTFDGTVITARLAPGLAAGDHDLELAWPDGRVARASVAVGEVAR